MDDDERPRLNRRDLIRKGAVPGGMRVALAPVPDLPRPACGADLPNATLSELDRARRSSRSTESHRVKLQPRWRDRSSGTQTRSGPRLPSKPLPVAALLAGMQGFYSLLAWGLHPCGREPLPPATSRSKPGRTSRSRRTRGRLCSACFESGSCAASPEGCRRSNP